MQTLTFTKIKNKQKNPKEASKQILTGSIQTRNTVMGLQSLRTVQKKNLFFFFVLLESSKCM